MNMQRTLVVSFSKSLKVQINLISQPTSVFFPEGASPLYAGVPSRIAKQSHHCNVHITHHYVVDIAGIGGTELCRRIRRSHKFGEG